MNKSEQITNMSIRLCIRWLNKYTVSVIAKLDVLYYKYLCCVFIIFSPDKYYFCLFLRWLCCVCKKISNAIPFFNDSLRTIHLTNICVSFEKKFLRLCIFCFSFFPYSPDKCLCCICKKIFLMPMQCSFHIHLTNVCVALANFSLTQMLFYTFLIFTYYSPDKCLCCICKFCICRIQRLLPYFRRRCNFEQQLIRIRCLLVTTGLRIVHFAGANCNDGDTGRTLHWHL